MKDETRSPETNARSRPMANVRCATRSPRFDPSAMATGTTLFQPTHSDDAVAGTGRSGSVGAAPKYVLAACHDLIEEALLLQRLPEYDIHHVAMPRVGHFGEPWPPPLDEGLDVPRVLRHKRIEAFVPHETGQRRFR